MTRAIPSTIGLRNKESSKYPVDVLSEIKSSKGGTKVMLETKITAITDTGINI